jgi:ABC-2 type transport system permease protein
VAIAAFVCALAFTGRLPTASVFAYVVPFGLAAMVLVIGLYVLIGLAAFWLGDISPLFWVAQKLLFILGGLMLPLSLYPEWMQRVAYWTPFPSLLAGPAGFMVGGGADDARWLLRDLMLWGIGIVLVAHVLFVRALRTLQTNGG